MDARLKSVHDRRKDARVAMLMSMPEKRSDTSYQLAMRSLEDQDRKIANDIGALEDQMLISEPVSVAHLEDQLNVDIFISTLCNSNKRRCRSTPQRLKAGAHNSKQIASVGQHCLDETTLWSPKEKD